MLSDAQAPCAVVSLEVVCQGHSQGTALVELKFEGQGCCKVEGGRAEARIC
jgi:hypothetical protein